MGTSKRVLNRPKKRTLVRWDENLNELLLLTVQSVCNKEGVKIPWAKVAQTMGNNVTEGAIVQHLAKLRTRRVAANKDVPPPLRRGGSGAAAVSKDKVEPKVGMSSSSGNGSGKGKRKSPESLSDEDEVAGLQEIWEESSDEEYGKRRRSKTNKRGQQKKTKTKSADAVIKIEDEDTDADMDMDDVSDGVVGVGAQFLDFSNYRELSSSPVADNQNAGPTGSKIVVFSFKERASHFKRLVKLLESDNDSAAQYNQALVLGNSHDRAHYQESDAAANEDESDHMLDLSTFNDHLQSGLPSESMFNSLFNEGTYHDLHPTAFSPDHHGYQNNSSVGGFTPSQQDQGNFLPYPNVFIGQFSGIQDSPVYPRVLPESAPLNLDAWIGTGLAINDNNGHDDQNYALVHHNSSASESGDNVNSAASGFPESVPKEDESFDDEGYGDVHSMQHSQLLNQFLGFPLMDSPDASH
ncbi:predicted protein [Paecilomyces variotii No. 5]|uniref:Myb-like domain-containing protein n=1 Tax=Byssochlamys spectabilis (strain No. 5 / NBRC 109023) TaxID=1356009 RepID=V5G101_BYSSN|nr:predicted protein [Paecilomyces variotii No. 5]